MYNSRAFNYFVKSYIEQCKLTNTNPEFYVNNNELSFNIQFNKDWLLNFNEDVKKLLINDEKISIIQRKKNDSLQGARVFLTNIEDLKEDIENNVLSIIRENNILNFNINNTDSNNYKFNQELLLNNYIQDTIRNIDSLKTIKDGDFYSIQFEKENNSIVIKIMDEDDNIIKEDNISNISLTDSDINSIICNFTENSYVSNNIYLLLNNHLLINKKELLLSNRHKINVIEDGNIKFNIVLSENGQEQSNIIHNGVFLKKIQNGGVDIFINSNNQSDFSILQTLNNICGSDKDIINYLSENFKTIHFYDNKFSPMIEANGMIIESRILEPKTKKTKDDIKKTSPLHLDNNESLLNNGIYLVALNRSVNLLNKLTLETVPIKAGILTNIKDKKSMIFKNKETNTHTFLINPHYIKLDMMAIELSNMAENIGLISEKSIPDIIIDLNNAINKAKKEYCEYPISLDGITLKDNLKLNNKLKKENNKLFTM